MRSRSAFHEYHVDWIGDCIAYMARNGFATIEPTEETQDAWTAHVAEVSSKILRRNVKNYMVHVNGELSESGWIAEHRKLYLEDGEAAHLWDSTVAGGPGPLPTLLLFTTGRKSGKQSIMPLLYGKVDGGYAIIASKGGVPTHPGWYHNLTADSDVKVKVINDEFEATARVASGAERQKIWAQMAEMYPPFEDYKKTAGAREIPVIVLEPKSS
jgi:deazaflavin-dependent oxidoreductase (nitroreductase family)